ncbi:hypothetical protein OH77DRAFT_1420112 [Trametes cingulata]|nr:hypothetical protein OH77DRAFT_1420112 [Trametes cingulata]
MATFNNPPDFWQPRPDDAPSGPPRSSYRARGAPPWAKTYQYGRHSTYDDRDGNYAEDQRYPPPHGRGRYDEVNDEYPPHSPPPPDSWTPTSQQDYPGDSEDPRVGWRSASDHTRSPRAQDNYDGFRPYRGSYRGRRPWRGARQPNPSTRRAPEGSMSSASVESPVSPLTPQDLDPRAVDFKPSRAVAADTPPRAREDVDLNQYMQSKTPASPSSLHVQAASSPDESYASLREGWQVASEPSPWLTEHKSAAKRTEAEMKGKQAKPSIHADDDGPRAAKDNAEKPSVSRNPTPETNESPQREPSPVAHASSGTTTNVKSSEASVLATELTENVSSPSRGMEGQSPSSSPLSASETGSKEAASGAGALAGNCTSPLFACAITPAAKSKPHDAAAAGLIPVISPSTIPFPPSVKDESLCTKIELPTSTWRSGAPGLPTNGAECAVDSGRLRKAEVKHLRAKIAAMEAKIDLLRLKLAQLAGVSYDSDAGESEPDLIGL